MSRPLARQGHRQGRARPAAVGAVVGLAMAVMAGAGGGAATAVVPAPAPALAPEPAPAIDLNQGMARTGRVTITDDAVYLVDGTGSGAVPLYRRALTTVGTTTTVGPFELIDRVPPGSAPVAVDGDSVAYVRAVGLRVVIRDGDGTRSFVELDYPLGWGVSDLTDTWIAGWRGPSYGYCLANRSTGRYVDLVDLAGVPEAPDGEWVVSGVEIDDTRAVFTLYWDGAYLPGRQVGGAYTVALGETGLDGAAVELERVIWQPDLLEHLEPIGVAGTTIAWKRVTGSSVIGADGFTETVSWLTAAPYTAAPTELVLPQMAQALEITDTSLVINAVSSLEQDAVVQWLPLTGDPTPTRTLVTDGPWVLDVHGTQVAHEEILGTAYPVRLSDAVNTLVGDAEPVPGPWPFSDVAGQDFLGAEILSLYDQGLMRGYADGTFRPTAPVSRQAMAAFLYRLGMPGVETADCSETVFDDVTATHPFCAEIAWLSETGITTGFPDGTFRGTAPVTREAMAAFVYRFAHDGANAPECTERPFTDVAEGNPFCGEIAWAREARIAYGDTIGRYEPTKPMSRQATAAFLYRFIDEGLVPTSDR